jgi:hypothetical protein
MSDRERITLAPQHRSFEKKYRYLPVHFSLIVKAYIDEETGEAESGKLVVGDEGISVDSLR